MDRPATPMERARHIFTTGKIIHDRIHRILTAHLASEMSHANFGDISVAQFHMLMVIRSRGQVSVKQLAGLLGVSPPSVSAMVDRLVEKNILTRKPDPDDRRKVVIRVSEIAMKHIETAEATVLQSFVDLVQSIGPEAAGKWCTVMEQVKAALEQNGDAFCLSPIKRGKSHENEPVC